jgi:orotidine-5'-phosphate decarboxylase
MSDKKLCLALDGLSYDESLRVLSTSGLGRLVHAVKVHALLDQDGPRMVSLLREHGVERIWVDYKIHDTKDTVGYRVAALRNHEVDIVTVHASGGVPMMREAVKAGGQQTAIWAITVLTSLDDAEIAEIYGRERTRQQVVLTLAYMARDAGVDGLVCSAQEVGMLYQDPHLAGLKLVVPGTRSVGVALGQQKRSGTPRQAIIDGATYLVVGSQVTKAQDPFAAFMAMEDEIKSL